MFSAWEIAKLLGGESRGRQFQAPCPVCQPERRHDQRALSVTDRQGGGLLVHCHKSGCAYTDIMNGLGLTAQASGALPRKTTTSATASTEPGPTNANRAHLAQELWAASEPISTDSPAAPYLRKRGIDLDFAALDHVIQFNASTPWARERVPAILVRMQTLPGMNSCGIQRIALDSNGGKLGKRMLGRAGYAFMSFDTCPGPALITEGPEDALAALMRYRLPVWAAMSAVGLSRFPVLKHWHTVAVLADGDDAGRSAALNLAYRWRAADRIVHILDAPDGRDPNAMIEEMRHD